EALLNHLSRHGDLVVQLRRIQRDQVRVAEALRVELPAGGEEAVDLALAEPTLGRRESAQLDVLHADPAEAAQHGEGLRVLGLISVVEAEDDRLARSQRYPSPPVGAHLVERHGVPARALERA